MKPDSVKLLICLECDDPTLVDRVTTGHTHLICYGICQGCGDALGIYRVELPPQIQTQGARI